MRCGNGKERAQHPVETFGPDWMQFLQSSEADSELAPREPELTPQRQGNDDLGD
jgi:hypothetical protein